MSIYNFNLLAESENPLNHVVQHDLFTIHIGSFEMPVSNHMVMALVAAVLMLIIFPVIARKKSIVPHGLRNFFEAICVFIREEVARPALGSRTDKYIPYLWTTFFFILFCNLLGLVPVRSLFYALSLGTIDIPVGGTATGNIWITGALAAFAFIMIHVSGVREQGAWNYIKNFIPHVPWPLILPMYALETIGAFVKPFALAIRLFANMLAGHTVLGALLGLVFMARSYTIGGVTVLGCAALSLLELFVAFLQAYIFTYLTALFIGAAVHPEH